MGSIFASNTATFGLSKDLEAPLSIKIGHLESSLPNPIKSSSEKYMNPSIFKKSSDISNYSELYVSVQVVDKFNELTVPVQTPYKHFVKKRVWNQQLNLPINYNQLTYDSYLKVCLWEIVDSKPCLYALGYLTIYARENSTLRTGVQKIPMIKINQGDEIQLNDLQLNLESELIQSMQILNSNSNSKLNNPLTIKSTNSSNYFAGDKETLHIPWLDKLTIPKLEEIEIQQRKRQLLYKKDSDKPSIHLFVELSSFEMPIVYSDETYKVSNLIDPPNKPLSNNKKYLSTDNNTSSLLNAIDIPMPNEVSVKIYDPDFSYFITNQQLQQINPLDPVEMKYHKLERNINNNSLLDRELKPSPQVRDELIKILQKPLNIELTDIEKNLIWKYRFYFSKNNIAINQTSNSHVKKDNDDELPVSTKNTTTIQNTKNFLTKFLKSINWDNDHELQHVFKELIPIYWSSDKIQIVDALELLGSYFNPYTLTTENKFSTVDISKTEEYRPQKIFPFVSFLRKFAVERLKLASADELQLYLLQLVQALNYEEIIFGNNDETDIVEASPLASFLISKAVENEKLGNFFYWYIKVENEDQLKNPQNQRINIYSKVLNTYIENLKVYSQERKINSYKHLKRQIWFIKKLTNLVHLLRSNFKKNEATIKKIQFLRDYIGDSSNEFLSFPEPFPLPLDPNIIICGCYPQESSVFKSSLAPLKITFKTITNYHELQQTSKFNKKNFRYGRYPLMFKIGDDLRQDQLVIQIIYLMDQLLKNENLDLRLTPYKILATSPVAGLIQFIPNETLDAVLADTYPADIVQDSPNNGILHYLRQHSIEESKNNDNMVNTTAENSEATTTIGDLDISGLTPAVERIVEDHAVTSDLGVSPMIMDNYVKSCAGYCVITYLLGVGDRHLDNLLLSPNGKFWHADFGYILGRDPKPFPPLMKLPIQVIDGMGGMNHENFTIFRNYCFITYTTLRKNSNLILNLFSLMLDANIPDIQIDPQRAIDKVEEKFCLEMSEEEAILHFQNLITDSVHALLPVVIDRLHTLAQYWRA